jgi:hypothetical protein
LVIVRDRDGCRGEGVGGDGVLEDAEGAGETEVLVLVGGDRSGVGQKTCLVI